MGQHIIFKQAHNVEGILFSGLGFLMNSFQLKAPWKYDLLSLIFNLILKFFYFLNISLSSLCNCFDDIVHTYQLCFHTREPQWQCCHRHNVLGNSHAALLLTKFFQAFSSQTLRVWYLRAQSQNHLAFSLLWKDVLTSLLVLPLQINWCPKISSVKETMFNGVKLLFSLMNHLGKGDIV